MAVARRLGTNMYHRIVALVFVALSSLPVTAWAQDAGGGADGSELEAEARARFSLGELYYSQGRFAEAAVEFEAAYSLHPHPLLLHNVYLARRDLGDVPGAVDALSRYLASATDLTSSERRLLESRLAAMQRNLPTSSPTEGGTTTDPGPVVEPEIDPDPIDDGLADPDPEPTPETPTSGGNDGLWAGAIAGYSVAGIALVSILITGPMAMSERSNLTCAPFCTNEQVATVRDLGIATDVMIPIAIVGAATGAILTAVAATSSSSVTVAPSVSAEHVGLVVGGTF